MLALLTTTLGVFWAWEFILTTPLSIPSWLQPLIVLAMSTGLAWPDWRLGLAAAGLVGVVHVLVTHLLNAGSSPAAPVVPRKQRIPRLPL